jgi:nucleoid-associated protein YgaU
MLDPNSRYYEIEQATINIPDGKGAVRPVRYLRRRFIPSNKDLTTLLEHTVVQGDRLDIITARYLGDPTQFWQICDANTVMCPEDLEEVGRTIHITLPKL